MNNFKMCLIVYKSEYEIIFGKTGCLHFSLIYVYVSIYRCVCVCMHIYTHIFIICVDGEIYMHCNIIIICTLILLNDTLQGLYRNQRY